MAGLTALQVKNAKPGRHADGRGLYLVVRDSGSRAWVLRAQVEGKRQDLGLGAADKVSLSQRKARTLERPTAFAVRLLDTAHQDFAAVQNFFDVVVKPVVEGELGYRLHTVDGSQAHGFARIDEEIFARLHRSAVVIADTTGSRPNCFIELGYAFGRGLPTIVTARAGSEAPFDIKTFSALYWKTTGTTDDRREAFRKHWQATRSRPPLVPTEDLIP